MQMAMAGVNTIRVDTRMAGAQGTVAEDTWLKSALNEVKEVKGMAPVVAPSIVPRGYGDGDLRAFAEMDGLDALAALERRLLKLGKGIQKCGLCGCEGSVGLSRSWMGAANSTWTVDNHRSKGTTTGEEDGDGDGHEESMSTRLLFFTTIWKTDFKNKILQLKKGVFACRLCRLVIDTEAFLSTMVSGNADVDEVSRHAMSVNRDLDVASSPAADAASCRRWARELISRTYALKILASNVQGWKMIGPKNKRLMRGGNGGGIQVAKLAAALLHVASDECTQKKIEDGKKRKRGTKEDDDDQGKTGGDANGAKNPEKSSHKHRGLKSRKHGPTTAGEDMRMAPLTRTKDDESVRGDHVRDVKMSPRSSKGCASPNLEGEKSAKGAERKPVGSAKIVEEGGKKGKKKEKKTRPDSKSRQGVINGSGKE